MSVSLVNLVWEQNTELNGNDLLVMLALAWWADDDGQAWPSVQSVADRTRLSVRAVQYILRRLHEAGFIRIEQGRGRGHSSTYHVIAGRFGECEKVQQPLHLLNKEGDREKVQNDAEKVQVATEKVQNPAIKGATAIAPNIQGKTEERQERQGERAKARPTPRQTSIPDDFAPTPDMIDKARKKYPQMHILKASEQWVGAMRANTQKYRYTDWNQAWWNGMEKAEQWGHFRVNGGENFGEARRHPEKKPAVTADGRNLVNLGEAVATNIPKTKGA